MSRVFTLICGVLLSSTAWSCRVAGEASPAHLSADRAEQRAVVEALVREADSIYLARVTAVSARGDVAEVAIQTTLKAVFSPPSTARFAIPAGAVTGCTAASRFRQVDVAVGQTYLVYVQGERILRAGAAKRERGVLTLAEERQLVQAAVQRQKDRLVRVLRDLAARPKVPPLFPDRPGLVLSDSGWTVESLTGLWADAENASGDLIVTTPTGVTLRATWDVAPSGAPSVEKLASQDLPLAFHLAKPVRDWQSLATALHGLLPSVAAQYR